MIDRGCEKLTGAELENPFINAHGFPIYRKMFISELVSCWCVLSWQQLRSYVEVSQLSWLERGVIDTGDRGTNPSHCNNI